MPDVLIGPNDYSTRLVLGFLLGNDYPLLSQQMTGHAVPCGNDRRTIVQAIFVAWEGQLSDGEIHRARQLDPIERFHWFDAMVDQLGTLVTIRRLPGLSK